MLVVPPMPPSTPSEPKAKVEALLITHCAAIVSETAKVEVVVVVATAGPPIHANPAKTPSPVIILMIRPLCVMAGIASPPFDASTIS